MSGDRPKYGSVERYETPAGVVQQLAQGPAKGMRFEAAEMGRCLSPCDLSVSAADYAERVLPHSRVVFEAIGLRDVPRIHFGVGTGELLPLIGVTDDAGVAVWLLTSVSTVTGQYLRWERERRVKKTG